MRIIGGNLRGIRLQPPGNLPVRPTTDMAKEALFNILQNRFDLETCKVLDLFAGTGNLTLEFASRGCEKILAVDQHFACIRWIKEVAEKHHFNNVEVRKADVFKLLNQLTETYDIIFADPPYNLATIPQIPVMVHERSLLAPDGLLVVEHESNMQMDAQPGYTETRKYGNSSFSFFKF
ncbi:MAG: 16S rRNA (guanine(966)-N(2))-methyltransferase RsmD [Pedobacter sp.]|nr:16S rRNA (guanine(966)-N(2))-methyltransferase RsmD [Pedobacter sp.]